MKKQKLLTIALSALVSPLMAQITIEQNDLLNLGSEYYFATDLMPTIEAGQAGSNQTWDFTSLSAFERDTVIVVSPNDSPYGPWVNSNRVLYDPYKGSATYYMSSPDGLDILGVSDQTGNSLFVPAENILKFPLTYGHTNADHYRTDMTHYVGVSFGNEILDSVRIVNYTTYNYVVDAWGSLNTPDGTFNVLRQMQHVLQNDTMWMLIRGKGWQNTPDVQVSEQVLYRFLDKQSGFPIVTLFDFENNDVIDEVLWMENAKISSVSQPEINDLMHLYPNPARGIVRIKYSSPEPENILIMDINSKVLIRQKIEMGENVINVSALKAGQYLTRLEKRPYLPATKLIIE